MSEEKEIEESEEKETNGTDLSKFVFVAIIGFLGGASVLGLIMYSEPLDEPIVGGLLDGDSCSLSGASCLTTMDLNRDDIYIGMIYGRHCESIGLISSVSWQENADGQKYGIPICMEGVE